MMTDAPSSTPAKWTRNTGKWVATQKSLRVVPGVQERAVGQDPHQPDDQTLDDDIQDLLAQRGSLQIRVSIIRCWFSRAAIIAPR